MSGYAFGPAELDCFALAEGSFVGGDLALFTPETWTPAPAPSAETVTPPPNAGIVWSTCLACDESSSCHGFLRHCGLCPVCYGESARHVRGFFLRIVNRWRKWHSRGCRDPFAEAVGLAFTGDVSPWQLALLALVRAIGWSTRPSDIGITAPRCLGASDRLQVPPHLLGSMVTGHEPIPQPVRLRFAAHGLGWLKALETSERHVDPLDPATKRWRRSVLRELHLAVTR